MEKSSAASTEAGTRSISIPAGKYIIIGSQGGIGYSSNPAPSKGTKLYSDNLVLSGHGNDSQVYITYFECTATTTVTYTILSRNVGSLIALKID